MGLYLFVALVVAARWARGDILLFWAGLIQALLSFMLVAEIALGVFALPVYKLN